MLKTKRRNFRWEDINMEDMELDQLNRQFSHSNKAEGKSPKTITWYFDMVAGYIKFLISAGLSRSYKTLMWKHRGNSWFAHRIEAHRHLAYRGKLERLKLFPPGHTGKAIFVKIS